MIIRLVFLVLVLFVCTACGPSTYLLEEPRTYIACISGSDSEQQDSFNAILEVITNRRGWTITELDRENYRLSAKVSRRNAWIPVNVSVNEIGHVLFLRDDSKPISRRWAKQLKRWLDMLEGNYSRTRCRSAL